MCESERERHTEISSQCRSCRVSFRLSGKEPRGSKRESLPEYSRTVRYDKVTYGAMM